jgi:hypothetical protein
MSTKQSYSPWASLAAYSHVSICNIGLRILEEPDVLYGQLSEALAAQDIVMSADQVCAALSIATQVNACGDNQGRSLIMLLPELVIRGLVHDSVVVQQTHKSAYLRIPPNPLAQSRRFQEVFFNFQYLFAEEVAATQEGPFLASVRGAYLRESSLNVIQMMFDTYFQSVGLPPVTFVVVVVRHD